MITIMIKIIHTTTTTITVQRNDIIGITFKVTVFFLADKQ